MRIKGFQSAAMGGVAFHSCRPGTSLHYLPSLIGSCPSPIPAEIVFARVLTTLVPLISGMDGYLKGHRYDAMRRLSYCRKYEINKESSQWLRC